jgi:hypothetical protein
LELRLPHKYFYLSIFAMRAWCTSELTPDKRVDKYKKRDEEDKGTTLGGGRLRR